MSFYFSFTAKTRSKLHELVDQQLEYPHVPAAVVAFIKASIDTYPDGTILQVKADGHKAMHHSGTTLTAASMNVTVVPVHVCE